MKKHYYVAAMLTMGSFLSFGQNSQMQQQQSNASPYTTQANQHADHDHGSNRSISVNNQGTLNVQQPTPNGVGPANLGEHYCKTHELNQKHYLERGILQQFNQNYMQSAMATNGAIPKTSGVNEISVIFHVVYNPATAGSNVSNALIMQVWQDLTEDYLLQNTNASNARSGYGFTPADANINFCLATQDEFGNPLAEMGVVRVSTTEDWYDSDGGEENKMKAAATGGSEIWDRNKYLNIWICDISTGTANPNSGTAGYAYRPTPTFLPSSNIDGIVLDFNLGMNNENVLTHEVGHYLGLDHTWGGSGGCTADDGFTDTPQTSGPSRTTPTSQTSTSCSGFQETCSGVQTQYENYMDYSNCTVMFTQEQANYMLSILQGIRGSLLLSPGCDPTNTPPNSDFASMPAGPAPVIIPQNASVSFFDQSTNAPTGWTWTISGTQGVDWQWINTTNANSQDPVAEFYTVGTYDVSLTASNSYGVDATPAIEPLYVQVAAAATGITCDTLRNWNTAENAGSIGWQAPSAGYVNGHALIGTDNAYQWAQPLSSPTTTDIKAIEFAPVIVNDGGGEVIWKIYADAGGVPGGTLASDSVDLADVTSGAWNQINLNPPLTGITGNFWVGYEITYTNPLDSFVIYSQIATNAAANTDWWYDGTAWESIATTTGNAAGTHSLVDVLTSTGSAPSMAFTATADSLCIGGDIMLDGSGSTNNIDYRWYVTDDNWVTTLETSSSSSNTFNFPYAAGNYEVYLFGSGSCLDDGVYMEVELLPTVAATVTPTATTCGVNNGSINVTGATGGDGTYYYSLDGINWQTSSVFNGLAPGDYDVHVATLWDNCEAIYTVNVATSSAGSGTASPNQTICPGDNATIVASGGTGYAWSDGVSVISASASTTVSPTNTTQYSCLITDGSGCQATVYTTVTVNTPIQPTISASATTICDGNSVTLTSSSAVGNVWSTTETSSAIIVTTAGPFSVSANDANGCPATSDPITITINPAPSINAGTVTDPNACATTTGSIEITGTGTGDISWAGTTTGNANGVSLPYTIGTLGAGAYNITFVDGNGCTSNLVSQGLNDPTPPTTPTITPSGATTFCDGGSVTLTSSYGTNNNWSTTETSASINVTASGTISVTYTDGSGCSSTSAPITITVNPNPTAPTITAGGPTTFCDGDMVTLTSSQGTGNLWSTTETTQSIDVSTSESITLTYTDANGCSTVSTTTDVTVNPLPTVALAALADLCDYNPAYTMNEGTPAGGTYSGTGVSGGVFDPAVAGQGTHTITYTYTDGNGCTDSASADIYVDGCISVDEVDLALLNIYPNPVENNLIIELPGDFNFEIIDTRGRIIQRGNAQDSFSVSTTNYEAGVYFVNVQSETISATTRVVKK